jgi:hypothetical protein
MWGLWCVVYSRGGAVVLLGWLNLLKIRAIVIVFRSLGAASRHRLDVADVEGQAFSAVESYLHNQPVKR